MSVYNSDERVESLGWGIEIYRTQIIIIELFYAVLINRPTN